MRSKNKKKKNKYNINIKKEEIMEDKLIYEYEIVTEKNNETYINRVFPKKLNNKQIINGNILYFRIGLKYKNKYYIKENDMKEICNIYIYYLDENNKKQIYQINLYEFYKKLLKEYKKEIVIEYIKKFCKKFQEPLYEEYTNIYDYYTNYIKNKSNLKIYNYYELDFTNEVEKIIRNTYNNYKTTIKEVYDIEDKQIRDICIKGKYEIEIKKVSNKLPNKINIFNKFIKNRKNYYTLILYNILKTSKAIALIILCNYKRYKKIYRNKEKNKYKLFLIKYIKQIIIFNTRLKFLERI